MSASCAGGASVSSARALVARSASSSLRREPSLALKAASSSACWAAAPELGGNKSKRSYLRAYACCERPRVLSGPRFEAVVLPDPAMSISAVPEWPQPIIQRSRSAASRSPYRSRALKCTKVTFVRPCTPAWRGQIAGASQALPPLFWNSQTYWNSPFFFSLLPLIAHGPGRSHSAGAATLGRLRRDPRQIRVVLVRCRRLGEERRERRADRVQPLVVAQEVAPGGRGVLDIERSVHVVLRPIRGVGTVGVGMAVDEPLVGRESRRPSVVAEVVVRDSHRAVARHVHRRREGLDVPGRLVDPRQR